MKLKDLEIGMMVYVGGPRALVEGYAKKACVVDFGWGVERNYKHQRVFYKGHKFTNDKEPKGVAIACPYERVEWKADLTGKKTGVIEWFPDVVPASKIISVEEYEEARSIQEKKNSDLDDSISRAKTVCKYFNEYWHKDVPGPCTINISKSRYISINMPVETLELITEILVGREVKGD